MAYKNLTPIFANSITMGNEVNESWRIALYRKIERNIHGYQSEMQ
jgi:hypothetical protein